MASLLVGEADAQQSAAESGLQELHERAVYATVRIGSPSSTAVGSGWLLDQSDRPLVVTNAHVARAIGPQADVFFYRGTSDRAVSVRAERFYVSQRIDLALLRLEADPPQTARPVRIGSLTDVWRGARVVLGGNPSAGNGHVLPFQTTEGVVTGHVAGEAYVQCGAGLNCVVVDAVSFQGSSGGPAFNPSGELVGMLWGGPTRRALTAVRPDVAVVQNTTFSYLIHVRTIARELRRLQRSRD